MSRMKSWTRWRVTLSAIAGPVLGMFCGPSWPLVGVVVLLIMTQHWQFVLMGLGVLAGAHLHLSPVFGVALFGCFCFGYLLIYVICSLFGWGEDHGTRLLQALLVVLFLWLAPSIQSWWLFLPGALLLAVSFELKGTLGAPTGVQDAAVVYSLLWVWLAGWALVAGAVSP